MLLGEVIVDDDGSGNRQIEARHKTPLGNLNNEFGGVEKLTWDTPDLGAEKKARSRRVGGYEEIGRGLIEFHGHEIPFAGPQMSPKNLDLGGKLNNFGEVLRCSRRLDVPLTIPEEDDL